jgi:hypothetical protein
MRAKMNKLFLCMIVLGSALAQGASLSAESGQPTMCATRQSQMNLPILLAGAGRDQCGAKCNNDLQSCVDRCPGIDEGNVVDPKYAARKCKAACESVSSQCMSGCPND